MKKLFLSITLLLVSSQANAMWLARTIKPAIQAVRVSVPRTTITRSLMDKQPGRVPAANGQGFVRCTIDHTQSPGYRINRFNRKFNRVLHLADFVIFSLVLTIGFDLHQVLYDTPSEVAFKDNKTK